MANGKLPRIWASVPRQASLTGQRLRDLGTACYFAAALLAAAWSLSSLDTASGLLLLAIVLAGLELGLLLQRLGAGRLVERQDDLSRKDELTGLPNRRMFLEELRACLEKPLPAGHFTALFFIDLDRFKGINDALGHIAGDRFLLEISSRLQRCIDGRGILARFGGDEFTLLVDQVRDRNSVLSLARKIMSQFNEEIVVFGHRLWANTSLGIAMVESPRPGADELLSMADAALYSAKARGRGQFVLFEPNLPRPTPRSLSLDADIRTAVDKGQLRLLYQPVVDLRSLQLTGLEALVRWRHPRDGLLNPSEFIPLAEETGVIMDIGRWVIEEACSRLSIWQGLFGDSLRVSVNLSALQFRQSEMLSNIVATSNRCAIDPSALQLEITESLLLQDDEQTLRTLRELRDMGFLIAVDDFGVGYSSLSYLKRFAIDVLKLDQSFLSGLEEPRAQALVQGTIQLGHSLGMKVVAEGIEQPEQLVFLRNAACDEGQGYLLSPPVSEKELTARLTAKGRDMCRVERHPETGLPAIVPASSNLISELIA